MRVDIDKQDILNVLADTKRRFDRAAIGLIVSLSITALMLVTALAGVARAATAIMHIAPASGFTGVMEAWRISTAPFLSLLTFSGLGAAAIATAIGIVRSRRKRAAMLKEEALANSLGAGRYDFHFASDKLTITGPLSVRKVAWATIARIEKCKSSILLTRKDGTADFLPRNEVKYDNFFDQLTARHGPMLNKACPYADANLQKPLSITYESAPEDLDAWRDHYFKERDGHLHFLRRVCQWRPWAPFLVLTLFAVGGASFYAAFKTYSLLHAVTALAFTSGAAGLFLLNSSYFRGPTHPFRKKGGWPYAQAELVTVTLSKAGVIHARHGATDIVKWEAFNGFVETKLFGYLVINPKQVIALPKRSFLDKPHYEDFARFAKRSIADARKMRSEKHRGRMMRTIDKPKAKTTLPALPKPAEAAPAQKSTTPAKPIGPSPKAAPVQIKQAQAPAALKPATTPARPRIMATPVKAAAKKVKAVARTQPDATQKKQNPPDQSPVAQNKAATQSEPPKVKAFELASLMQKARKSGAAE